MAGSDNPTVWYHRDPVSRADEAHSLDAIQRGFSPNSLEVPHCAGLAALNVLAKGCQYVLTLLMTMAR